MKTILWYQPEKFGVPDVICQDGEIISGFQREEAIDLLKAASDVCIKHDLPWCGHVRLSKNKREKVLFFVKGTFKGVDECGRTLSFMFLSAKSDDYLETLNKELQVVHQELSEGTIKCIEKKKSSFNEYLIFILIVLVITIIISFFL